VLGRAWRDLGQAGWHTAGSAEEAWRRLRNGAPFKDWDLPSGLAQVRAKLAQHADGDRQFVKVLGAVPGHGLAAVEAALPRLWRPVLAAGDVILAILARSAPTVSSAQHHHARCAAPEHRTRGRLWPL